MVWKIWTKERGHKQGYFAITKINNEYKQNVTITFIILTY